MDTARPHSADWLAFERDLWWNADYLDLLAKRLNLGAVEAALDVGCGKGSWGHALLPVLKPGAHVTGVDREQQWIEKAQARALERGFGGRTAYRTASAEDLPFGDANFDLVTCQTLLIHLADPKAAVIEMLRVLTPGGTLLLVEPSNAAGQFTTNSVTVRQPLDRRLALIRLYLTCERGRAALGLGDNSFGDQMPALLASLEVEDIRISLADKAFAVYPPYDGDRSIFVSEQIAAIERDITPWDERESRRYFLAGGGSAKDFSRLWKERVEENREVRNALANQDFVSAGATVMYLASARKPG